LSLSTLLTNPNALLFGTQDIHTRSTPQTIYVVNLGPTPLNAVHVGITGTRMVDFAETNTCGRARLLPDGGCTIRVWFTPVARGTRTATILIADNAAQGIHNVPLQGQGR
jgi:hypothetical protein